MEVCKAQSSDTLKLSPDDEIEGEIVYLQSRLLDGVVSMKQRYGKFFCHVHYYSLCSRTRRFWLLSALLIPLLLLHYINI